MRSKATYNDEMQINNDRYKWIGFVLSLNHYLSVPPIIKARVASGRARRPSSPDQWSRACAAGATPHPGRYSAETRHPAAWGKRLLHVMIGLDVNKTNGLWIRNVMQTSSRERETSNFDKKRNETRSVLLQIEKISCGRLIWL